MCICVCACMYMHKMGGQPSLFLDLLLHLLSLSTNSPPLSTPYTHLHSLLTFFQPLSIPPIPSSYKKYTHTQVKRESREQSRGRTAARRRKKREREKQKGEREREEERERGRKKEGTRHLTPRPLTHVDVTVTGAG